MRRRRLPLQAWRGARKQCGRSARWGGGTRRSRVEADGGELGAVAGHPAELGHVASHEDLVRELGAPCGREGCRRRATPPSLRFLGRRVYLGVVVIVASVVAQALGAAGAQATGVPRRTTRRWLAWWRGPFLATEVLLAIRARLVGVDVGGIPRSIIERLPGTADEQMRTMLYLLAPLTTGSVLDGARYLRDIA